MSFGLLGTLARESEHTDLGDELTQVEDIAGEAAFDDASEIAREAEMDAAKMIQGLAVADRLEEQADYGEALVASGSVDKSAVALARESMCLAITALGGNPTKSDYVVSRESMDDSPVQAMAVTVEGIKSTTKNIYEGIKMLFKKIVNQIKKLVAKLIVAVNRTGKKAEKMLKSFKAEKNKTAKESKLEANISDKLRKSLAGYLAIGVDFAQSDVEYTLDKTVGAENKCVANMKAIAELNDGVSEDVTALDAAMNTKPEGDATGTDAESAAIGRAIDATDTKSVTGILMKVMLKGKKSTLTADEIYGALQSKNSGMVKGSDLSSLDPSLPSGVEGNNYVFTPLYAKHNTVHGLVHYVEKVEESDKADARAVMTAIKSATATVDGFSSDNLSKSEGDKVMAVDKIDALLTSLKPASKKLKTFSDARLKEIDKLNKDIANVAKKKSGFSLLNRFANREYNHVRVFVASHIFAKARTDKALLRVAAEHIRMYEEV